MVAGVRAVTEAAGDSDGQQPLTTREVRRPPVLKLGLAAESLTMLMPTPLGSHRTGPGESGIGIYSWGNTHVQPGSGTTASAQCLKHRKYLINVKCTPTS